MGFDGSDMPRYILLAYSYENIPKDIERPLMLSIDSCSLINRWRSRAKALRSLPVQLSIHRQWPMSLEAEHSPDRLCDS